MRRALLLLPLLASLAACAGPSAPDEDGVCWRGADSAGGGAPRFSVLARGIDSLETCAVLLEAAHLQGAPQAEGAYQGYFIFVNAAAITSGHHLGGLRYPIFQPPQRAQVDRDLKRLISENNGRMPDAGQISLERH